ncbi:hypothetical protein HispidOSU_014895 [Sigmodon hispidus]
MVNLSLRKQLIDLESNVKQGAGWKTRSLASRLLDLTQPGSDCGKTSCSIWCGMDQRMMRLSSPCFQKDGENSEIMSGKLFELLRNKKRQEHKVLLHPSPHQPGTPQ